MPQSYSDSLNRTLAAKAKDLAESLSGYSLENAVPIIGEFSDANQSRIVLLNEKGEIVREWLGNGSLVSEVTISSSVSEEEQPVTEGFAEESTAAESGDWESQTDQEVSYGDTIGTVVEGEGSVVEEMEQQAMGHYEVAFKGSFNIRLSPDLHKKLFIYTTAHQMSMNKYIEDTLKDSPAAQIIV